MKQKHGWGQWKRIQSGTILTNRNLKQIAYRAKTTCSLSKSSNDPKEDVDEIQIEENEIVGESEEINIDSSTTSSNASSSDAISSSAPSLIIAKRKRRIRGEDGHSWINEADLDGRVIAHSQSKRATAKKIVGRRGNFKIDPNVNPTDNPFYLIDLSEGSEAPFEAEFSLEALLTIDYHTHLSYSEVIGLLGGVYDTKDRILRVLSVFPCERSGHEESLDEPSGINSQIECEMDPVSEMQACEAFGRLGHSLIGWYHSHPTFRPSPSLRDIETQTIYQVIYIFNPHLPINLKSMMQDSLEPFIGVIVSPYSSRSMRSTSPLQVLHISKETAPGNDHFRMPVAVQWKVVPTIQNIFDEKSDLRFKLTSLRHRYIAQVASQKSTIDYEKAVGKICQRYRLLGLDNEGLLSSLLLALQ